MATASTPVLEFEGAPAHFRPLDFSESAIEGVWGYLGVLKNKIPNSLDKRSQLQLVRPFAIENTRRSIWRSEEKDAFNDTIEGIEKLLHGTFDKSELGKLLYARIANRVTRAISFLDLACGDSQKAKAYLSEHLFNEEIEAKTESPPILFDHEHLTNMAESIAMGSETEKTEIAYALPYKLYQGKTEYSRLDGKVSFSLSGISAELDLPPLRRYFKEITSSPTSNYQATYVAECHEVDPATFASLQAIKDSDDPIASAIAQSQMNLRHSPLSIAANTVSPEDPRQIAQLAVRGGYRDNYTDQINQKRGLYDRLTDSDEPPRGPLKSFGKITHTLAIGLLQNIQAGFDAKGKYNPVLVESGRELTLKGEAGDAYVVQVVDGKLTVAYQNPTLFKTNPGEYWQQAVNGINDIYRTLYEFYGFDTRTVKVEVPAKFKEVHIANLELVKPENCKGRMDWIGGYEKVTMDKIVAAEQAVLKHFESDSTRLDTAPNIIMDGPTGSGKTFVSEALMASFAEKLGPKGVATYRLTTTQQMTAQDIILDLRTWSRMKGKSILLVEDLYQKIRLLKSEEAGAVLTTLNDVAKRIADSKDQVLILNTEYLAETVKGGRAITEPHRFPFFMELQLDHSPGGIEDAFRAIVTKELSKQVSGIKKDAPEVTEVLQRLSNLGPDVKQSLWEAIFALPDSQVMTPGILHDVLSVKALSQRDKNLDLVDGALILKLMPDAITDELARIKIAGKDQTLVEKIWEALQPLVELGKGDLRQGVAFVIELMRRNEGGQQQIANILLASRDRQELFDDEAIAMLQKIVQGKTTIPAPQENS